MFKNKLYLCRQNDAIVGWDTSFFMLVVADKYIPFLDGIIEPYAEVIYLDPQEINSETIKEADALFVRTRTRCDESLLKNSRVRFIATATIGYDHIDTHYCETNGIRWTNAPGCNAQGVCDYVEAALQEIEKRKLVPAQPTIGIIGVGHVGSLVAKMAAKRGYRVLLNDPPRMEAEGGLLNREEWQSISTIQKEADVITFHTPLNRYGKYPTFHLCDRSFLDQCQSTAVIINAARGGVVDEQALLSTLNKTDNRHIAVLDTWEGEPRINKDLLNKVLIGTYHIAGYTLQGKVNATNMCLQAFCQHFQLPSLQIPQNSLPLQPERQKEWILQVDKQLKANPEQFETLRETYRLR